MKKRLNALKRLLVGKKINYNPLPPPGLLPLINHNSERLVKVNFLEKGSTSNLSCFFNSEIILMFGSQDFLNSL